MPFDPNKYIQSSKEEDEEFNPSSYISKYMQGDAEQAGSMAGATASNDGIPFISDVASSEQGDAVFSDKQISQMTKEIPDIDSPGAWHEQEEKNIAEYSIKSSPDVQEKFRADYKAKISDARNELNKIKGSLDEKRKFVVPNPIDPVGTVMQVVGALNNQANIVNQTNKYLNELEARVDAADKAGKSAIKLKVKNAEDLVSLGFTQIFDNFRLKDIAEKYNETGELTEPETMALATYGMLQDIKRDVEVPMTYNVVGGIIDALPYMATFIATSGASSASQAALQKGLNVTAKKSVANFAKRGLSYLTTSAGRSLAFPQLYSGFAERRVGDVTAKDGVEVTPPEETPVKSALKAYAITASEVVTEGMFDDVFKIGKGIVKGGKASQLRKAAKIGSYPVEFGEEMVNALVQAPIEGEDVGDVFTPRMIMETALVTGAINFGFSAGSFIESGVKDAKVSNNKYKMVKLGGKLNTDTKKKIDDTLEKIDYNDPKSISDATLKVEQLFYDGVKNKEWNLNQVKDVTNYIDARNKDQSYENALSIRDKETNTEKSKEPTETLSPKKDTEVPLKQESLLGETKTTPKDTPSGTGKVKTQGIIPNKVGGKKEPKVPETGTKREKVPKVSISETKPASKAMKGTLKLGDDAYTKVIKEDKSDIESRIMEVNELDKAMDIIIEEGITPTEKINKKLDELRKKEIRGKKKETAINKIAVGSEDLANSLRAIKSAVGEKNPDAFKAMKEIAEGVWELGVVGVDDLVVNMKKYISGQYKGAERKKIYDYIDKNKNELERFMTVKIDTKKEDINLKKRIRETTGVKKEGEKIIDTEYNLLKEKIKDYAKGAKREKRDIEAIQKEVYDFMRKEIPASILKKDPTNKTKLLQLDKALKDAHKKPEKLNEAFNIITDFVIDKKKNITKKDIDKKFKTTRPVVPRNITKQKKLGVNEQDLVGVGEILYKNDTKKADNLIKSIDNRLKGRITEDQKNFLEAQKKALEFVRDKDMAEMERSGMLENFDNWKDKDFTTYELLGMVGGKDMSLSELIEANSVLDSMIKTGKTKHKAKEDIRQSELKQKKEGIKNILSKGGEKELLTEAQKEKGSVGFMNKMRGLRSKIESLPTLMEYLSRSDKKTNPFQGELVDMAVSVGNAEIKRNREIARSLDAVAHKAETIFGDKWQDKVKKNSEKNDVMLDVNGKESKHSISKNEALHYIQLYESGIINNNKSAMDTFEKMGWSSKTINQLYDYITDKGKNNDIVEWKNWQVQEFYPSYYNKINEVYRDVFGINLPFVESYVPSFRKVTNQDSYSDLLNNGSNDYTTSTINSSLKTRKVNYNEFGKLDANELMIDHVRNMEHFIHMTKPINEFKAIFNDPIVKEYIDQHHGGAGTNGTIKRFIEDLERGQTDPKLNIKAVDWAKKNYVSSKIGLNIPVLIKQLTSFPAYMGSIPTNKIPEYTKYSAELWTNPVKNFKDLLNTPFLKERYDSNRFNRDLVEAKNSLKIKDIGKMSFRDKFMITAKLGDAAAIVQGGYPYYKIKYNEYRESMGHAEAKIKALKDFEEVTRLTQQSGELSDLSHIQRWGSIGKAATMFQNAPMQYARMEMAAWTNLAKGRGNAVDNLKNIAIYHFVLPGLFQLASSPFTGADKEDWVRTTGLGSLAYIFIAGDLVEEMYNSIVKDRSYGLSFLPEDVANEVIDAPKKIRKALEDDPITVEDIIKAADAGMDVIGDLTGVPVGNLGRYAEGIYDYTTGRTSNELRILGYSNWSLGEQYLNNEKTQLVHTAVSKNKSLEWLKYKAKKYYGNQYDKKIENELKKKYGIYKTFGFNDENVRYLLRPFLSNEERAEYLLGVRVDKGESYIRGLKDKRVISQNTWDLYQDKKKRK